MKHTITKTLMIGILACCSSFSARADKVEDPQLPRNHEEKTLTDRLTDIQKKTDKLNLYLDMHGAAHLNFEDGFQNGNFELREFRIEARGQLTDWLSYRYRQKLNRSNNGSVNVDNIPSSIDFACLNFQITPRFGFTVGRQGAAYGGTEYDLNPIEVYEYADFTNNTEAFMTGVCFSYLVTPTQELNFQVLNNRNAKSTVEMYGADLKDVKLPLVYTLNWNGNFSEQFIPRWSVSYIKEPLSKDMYFMTLGNEFKVERLGGYVDFTYSKEGLDRTGMVARIINPIEADAASFHVASSRYVSTILKLNYQFTPQWNVFAKGMYEEALLTKVASSPGVQLPTGKYQTSYGYMTGLEYYPMQDSNMRFFLTYVGRSYRYEGQMENVWEGKYNPKNYDTNRVSLGFVYHLPLF